VVTRFDEETRTAITHLLLPDLRAALETNPESAVALFDELHGADAADLLARMEIEEVHRLMMHFPAPEAARILEFVDPSTAVRYLEETPGERTADILEEMDPDEAADLISHLEEKEQAEILGQMEREEREDAEELLRHGEDTAGRLMTQQYVTVRLDDTAAAALEQARVAAREEWSVGAVFVVDEDEVLKGKLTLRSILAAHPDTPVREVMEDLPPAVHVDVDQEQAASIMSKYDLITLPVLDDHDRLVGIVTVDDVVDVLIEEGTEDVQMLGAMEPLEHPYFETSFWSLTRKRGLWLSLLFLAQTLTGNILHHNSKILADWIWLAIFLPLIISSGGNSGSQSATLITRALAVGEVHIRDFLRVLYREVGTGFALGVFLGGLGIIRALLWKTGIDVALIVMLATLAVVTMGTLIGSMLPLIFKKIGLDPAITSSPFVASLVDISGITIYLLIARAVLM